jgi:hypothetical protein
MFIELVNVWYECGSNWFLEDHMGVIGDADY